MPNKRLARAVATAGDNIPELVAELRLRNDRIRRLEADWPPLAAHPPWWPTSWPAPRRPPAPSSSTSEPPSTADLPAMREVFQSLFPEGLTFLGTAVAARVVSGCRLTAL